MRVLVLTFYFKPDLCAGSFRATAFVDALREQDPTLEIDVLTTVPNRYKSFDESFEQEEHHRNVHIKRFVIPRHKSGLYDQSLSFSRYAFQVLKETRGKKYDLVYATSSRLFTACLGSLVARLSRARLYLDIRDIFVETMEEVLEGKPLRHVVPLLGLAERWTMNRADKINLVSEGFKGYFDQRYPGKQFSFFTNGIDEEFLSVDFNHQKSNPKPVILYAGNIGDGQGLHRIIPQVASLLAETHTFWIVGDGQKRPVLEQEIAAKGLGNVTMIDPVNRTKLIEYYARADYLFLHLNDFKAFLRVLPSKVFEFGATGKPILAGVSGYTKEFIEQHLDNAAVFDCCNADQLVQKLQTLDPDWRDRSEFKDRFARSNIMAAMSRDVLSIAG